MTSQRALWIAGLSVAMTLHLQAALITEEEALQHPDFPYVGEFKGAVDLVDSGVTDLGIQVAARGDGAFEALVYYGGLPGDGWYKGTGERVSLNAQRTSDELSFGPHAGMVFEHRGEAVVAVDEAGNQQGRLARVVRGSPTMGKAPPDEAIALFNGTDLRHWRENAQMTEDGLLQQGARTADDYADKYLHLEFMTAFTPGSAGSNRSNSGVYIQNRYEVQILESFAEPATISGNASLYNEHPPLLNMTYPPLQWQTYDIYFRAPRSNENGEKTENVRITVYHNGVLVHKNVELEQGTGAGGGRGEVPEAELYLQSHTGPVRFRNVWLVEDAADWEPRTWEPDTRPAALPRLEGTETLRLDAVGRASHWGAVSGDRNHPGHTGGGFANFGTDGTDSGIRWEFDVESPGVYDLRIYYALEAGNRPLHMRVNDQVVDDALDFPATGDWAAWAHVSTRAELQQGKNVIQLEQIDIRGANIDRMEIERSPE